MSPAARGLGGKIIFIGTVAGSVMAIAALFPLATPAFSSIYAALTLPRKTSERVTELEKYRNVAIVNDYYIRYYVTAIGKRLSIPPPPPPPRLPYATERAEE